MDGLFDDGWDDDFWTEDGEILKGFSGFFVVIFVEDGHEDIIFHTMDEFGDVSFGQSVGFNGIVMPKWTNSSFARRENSL